MLEGTEEYAQSYQPIAYNGATSRKYGAVSLPGGGFLQAGYSYAQFKHDVDEYVFQAAKNRHIGNSGKIIICDSDWNLIEDSKGRNLMDMMDEPDNMREGQVYRTLLDGEPCMFSYLRSEGYYIVGTLPEAEADFMRDASIYVSILMEILIFAMLFLLVYFLIKKVIINNLHKINASLSEITDGNLNVQVNVRTNEEFSSLSDDINSTVSTLKRYIAETAARIDKELEYAKQIQLSALPSKFPPYPQQDRFDIYAQMIAAKEVGGDFYDFYLLDEDRVAILCADVSGKGIPAALFMMRAKTIIKELAERRLAVNEILTLANEKLCESNESAMFVTAWMGILDLTTGKLQYANAGHNPPVLLQNGTFTYLKSRPGFVLAGMEGIRYRLNEMNLAPGDRIFLYTDGVTEATDAKEQLYGEERLLTYLNGHAGLNAHDLLHQLKEDIDRFVGDAPQFDDMTMLMLDYMKGGQAMKEKTFPADARALGDVQAFLEGELEQLGCPMKLQMAISIAIEEIFVNIAHYAYNGEDGTANVGIAYDEPTGTVTFRFRDHGKPFNPLEHQDPDITASVEERDIGGLGILITRKTMDNLEYSYEHGENVLTMQKKIL
ncbi:MAG: SpoIIE family protein phosphatase [Clostridia bacterium]|nr:SpoIIE family protein phosphatase [Clostridia bacterium]